MAQITNLETLLTRLTEAVEGEHVSVREMLSLLGRRTYGPVLLLLGVIAISPLTIVPGLNWLIALAVLIIAGQIVIGRRYPWLPQRTLEISFSREAFCKTLTGAMGYARWVDRFIKPRLSFLTRSPFIQVLALGCIGAALVTFPLGFVPLGPVLPSLAILLFGLAMTARDGVVMLFFAAGFVGSIWLVFRLGGLISSVGGL